MTRARPARRCSIPFVRETVRQTTARDQRRPDAPHLERPARRRPRRDRREDRATRATPAGRRSRPCAADGRDDLRDDPRQPVARRSATPTCRRCSPGASRATASSTRSTATAPTPRRSCRTGAATLALVAAKPLRLVVRAGPAARAEGRRAGRRSTLPVRRGQVVGRVEIWSGEQPARAAAPLVAVPGRRPAGPAGADRLVREPDGAQRARARLVSRDVRLR